MLTSSVDCLCHKHLFPHPFPLLHLLEKSFIFIILTYCRWYTYLFDVSLAKEYKLGGFQWRKMVFVVTGWYLTYLCLLPFVISKKYGECEMSWVVIFVSVYHIFEFLFCTYYFPSGSLLSIINHCFVWCRLDSFHLPSLFVPCWIFFIFVLLGCSLKRLYRQWTYTLH